MSHFPVPREYIPKQLGFTRHSNLDAAIEVARKNKAERKERIEQRKMQQKAKQEDEE